ncbi:MULTISPECIES: hypothetical protein [Peribacillus]|uniref:hypothetical protein n=1 Tax=Peribacillus TaxID=2675229 RepID=UPI001F4F0435|nr:MULTISPECIES: hypothetical protein [unclassified Peribacillus]MCK1981658.1 hypothetical protein [Peribacillus sp. Aquil_B1]MCK2009620.1 hypothetical protein [Peribacillus sp. Aquil_B8]
MKMYKSFSRSGKPGKRMFAGFSTGVIILPIGMEKKRYPWGKYCQKGYKVKVEHSGK